MKTIEYIDRKTGEIKLETPPGERFLRFLYHHPFGKIPLNLLVKRKFLSAIYGKLMDTPQSHKRIAPFVKQYNVDMSEAEKSINEYTSFNDFFTRKLNPSARPIQPGLVSPADGKIIAFEDVAQLKNFFVKGNKFTLAHFLQDTQLAENYKNASLIIVRLAPNDYHRFHFPSAGKISQPTQIKGSYYSVSPYAVAENFARVFCENKREYAILATPDKGDILISPVGATMVGSIIQTYSPDTLVQKGDEMGYFAFGGSSILMLIDRKKFTIAPDILQNTKNNLETKITFGQTIAT